MTSSTSETTALPPELQALENQAQALATESAPEGGAPVAPEAGPDYASDAAGLVDIAAESLGAFYPSTESILTPEKRAKIAAPLAKVMEKYGLDLASILGKWGPEISLAFAVSQVAIPLAKAIQSDRDADAAAKAVKIAATAETKAGNPVVKASAEAPAATLHEKA